MSPLIRFGTVFAFVTLTATTLLAQATITPESPPGDLVDALWSSWGNWPVVVGLIVSLLIHVWRKFEPELWSDIPARLRPLIPLLMSGLFAGAAALLTYGDFVMGLKAATIAWTVAVLGSDVLRVATGKPAAPEGK
jgi:hypothetical protein